MEDTHPASVESLIAEIGGPNDDLAGEAALKLGSMGAGAAMAVPSLVMALGRRALASRASHALATIGEPAVPALIPALENLHREIRKGSAL
ncbi:MAG TPA: hypothetical protein VNO55_12840, partial [Polyangia bacterium]|nr:hypothetical protein [Polyangia bacterium]